MALPGQAEGEGEGEGRREGEFQGETEGKGGSTAQHSPTLLLPVPLSQPQSPKDTGNAAAGKRNEFQPPPPTPPALDCSLLLGDEKEEGEREDAGKGGVAALDGVELPAEGGRRKGCAGAGEAEWEQEHERAHALDDMDCSEDLHMAPPLAEMACDEITRMLNHEASGSQYHQHHLHLQQLQQQQQHMEGRGEGGQHGDELDDAHPASSGAAAAGAGGDGVGAEAGEAEAAGGRRRVELAVKEAWLSPGDMADGYWPDSYVLSDHAILTARLGVHIKGRAKVRSR